jgi:hypothetical protein
MTKALYPFFQSTRLKMAFFKKESEKATRAKLEKLA